MNLILLLALASTCLSQMLLTKEKADELRALNTTWNVVDPDQSIFKNMTWNEFASRFKTEWPDNSSLPELGEAVPDGNLRGRRLQGQMSFPESFDGRKEWGKCIHQGKDQAKCNGCWAFGVTNHMSDRFCIAGQDVVLSVQDLLECAEGNKCCNGGSAENAYKHMMNIGVVAEDCKLFDKKCDQCRPSSCKKYKCYKNSAWVSNNTMRAKWEIKENGPITGIYDIHADFAYYDGGVYYRTTDDKIGVHSVTIVGWGKENGIEYWICKNSWGDLWGEEGYFRIKIGDSNINSFMTSCLPFIEP